MPITSDSMSIELNAINKKPEIGSTSLKKKLSCCICNEQETCALDFHHVDSVTKDFAVSNAIVQTSKMNVLKEISKCAIVCASCHRKIHAGKIDSSRLTKNRR